jgi:diguanylate cyclase (GGDEF)-like protein
MQLTEAEKTKLEVIQLIFKQTVGASVAHLFAITLIAFWFSDVAPVDELLIWVSAVVLISILRITLFFAFKQYANERNSYLWLHVWTGLFFMLGVIYVYGLMHFTPVNRPEYLVSIGLFVVAFTAASAIGHTASLYASLSFFIPIMIPSVAFLFVYGGSVGNMTAFTLIIYSITALHMLKKSNKAYQRSIFLNFEHTQEIEKRKQIEKQLHDISRKDSLTDLFNRRYFDEMLEIEIGRAKRNNLPLCLIMFDVDCFKEYNDKYGHVTGDNCLIQIAEIAQSLVSRQGDMVARYGGEEFAIILPNIELDGAVWFANNLQERIIDKNIAHSGSTVANIKCVTVSLGVTNLIVGQETTASELIENADVALYEAKNRGRNRVHFETKKLLIEEGTKTEMN